MKRTATIFLMALMLAVGINLQGQQKTAKPAVKGDGAAKRPMPVAYLGNSDYKGGTITKDRFSSLMKEGLTSHDSLGNKYRVVSFDFSYAEQKVYEDSIGNLIKVLDFTSLYCKDNMLPTELTTEGDPDAEILQQPSIYQRIKAGDTIYFDRVKVMSQGRNSIATLSDSIPVAAKGMKCIIIK